MSSTIYGIQIGAEGGPSTTVVTLDSLVQNNVVQSGNSDIVLFNSAGSTVQGNFLPMPPSQFGSGIDIYYSNNDSILANQIDDAPAPSPFSAILLRGTHDNLVEYNYGYQDGQPAIQELEGASNDTILYNNLSPNPPSLTFTIAAGNNQTATVTTAFATNLAVDIRDAGGTPVQNVSVTFAAPGSGASGHFGSDTSVTVVTDASGQATAPTFVANTIAGSYAVTATVAGSSNPSTSFSLTNAPATPDHFLLAAPAGATVGTPVSVTVTVKDMFDNTVPSYTGTVHFSSSDPRALLPADYTFMAKDQGQHSFSIIFQDAGVQSVTATAQGPLTGSVNLNVSVGTSIQPGQTAGIGFWHSKRGQDLIRSFNGGPESTALANWLATTFPNLYGAGAGANNLTGKSNADVARFYRRLFAERGPKLDAQVLATALNVYATTHSLGGTAGRAYGFVVSDAGLGASVFNAGTSGAAFGVPNKSILSVLEILRRADARAVNGVLYNGDRMLRDLALDVFDGINEAGSID